MADENNKPSENEKTEKENMEAEDKKPAQPEKKPDKRPAEAASPKASPKDNPKDKKSDGAKSVVKDKAVDNPEAQSKPETKKKSSPLRTVALTALVTLIAGASALTYWRGDIAEFAGLGGTADAEKIATLESRLAALETAKEEGLARDAALAAETKARAQELAGLATQLQDIEAGGSEEAIANNLEVAKGMIENLETRMTEFEASTGETSPLLQNDENPGQLVQGADPEELAALQSSFADLSTRFENMGSTLEESAGRIDALEESAPDQNLDNILESLTPRSEVESLSERLKIIEDTNPAEAARLAVVALSATELSRAAATSAPFVDELEAFVTLAPNHPLADKLALHSAQGVATEKTLLLEFPRVSDAIESAVRTSDGDGFFAKLWNKITGLFKIRRVGEIEGDTWQAVLARAENRIALGDINAAAGELDALTGKARLAATPWMNQVANRRALDGVIAQLNSAAFLELLTALEDN